MLRILAVEDEAISRRVLSATLERLGHQVTLASDGREAWQAFLTHQMDVVITDWMMPELDGLELIRRIREAPRERYTYVVLLTALEGRQRYLDGMNAGADDLLSKPLDPEELHARLRVAERILGLQRTVQQLEGLLPICAYCKKIRDEAQAWLQVEEYVARHSDVRFSHGVCPECFENQLQPQLDKMPQIPRPSAGPESA